MSSPDAKKFHKLYGRPQKRISYQDKDFLDYLLMTGFCALVLWFGYGANHVLAVLGLALCGYMAIMFPIRHGVRLQVPLILRVPQNVLFLAVHKIQNIKAPYLIALALMVAQHVLIQYTPTWPHQVDWMRTLAIGLFWAHLLYITGFRTAVMIAHLRDRDHVRAVLSESVWKWRAQTPAMISREIVFAYATGLLSHLVFLIPWFLVITHVDHSLVLTPLTLILAFVIFNAYSKTLPGWFYRDHWLAHNSELDFVYLHGTHHDAIPGAMIAVAGNGHLEGLVRTSIGHPTAFLNPIATALFFTFEVKLDMHSHQYIPGIYPKPSKEDALLGHHALHHYGRLQPYGLGIDIDQATSDEYKKKLRRLPDEYKYSIRLEQQLTDYEWDNAKYRWYLDLMDRYHDGPKAREP